MEQDIILKNSIEEIISNGIWTGEEVDITTAKIYKLFREHFEYKNQTK